MAIGRGSTVSVKARLEWRLLAPSCIFVSLQVKPGGEEDVTGAQGSAASKSAEAGASVDLGILHLGNPY
jgi:hypothetical protein